MTRAACLLSVVLLCGAVARAARADDETATASARTHYEMGLKLFDARDHEQALIEFEKANEIKSRPAALFMMAQCQYLLGRLKEARSNYQKYIDQNPDGEFAALARDRVEAIDKRPAIFVINAVPEDVTVLISHVGMLGEPVATGQAPNNFSVPSGHYRIDVTKPNYQGQTRIVDVDVAETKPLFFKLEPIPARLEIETIPRDATLYVNGNRARNPYRQVVVPGPVEIFAEAPDYEPRALDLSLTPGQHLALVGGDRFELTFRQRSGRPELIAASAVLGGFIGAAGVAAAIGSDVGGKNVSAVLLSTGGAISGGVLGALVATPIVPRYIPDTHALYILGGMWIGAAEGFGTGVVAYQIATHEGKPQSNCGGTVPCRPPVGDQLQVGFIGSLAGLGLGLTASGLTAKHASSYGRGWLIQSAAAGGGISGALFQLATQWKPYGTGWQLTSSCSTYAQDPASCNRSTNVLDLAPGTLIGLNVGLAAGFLAAYLPDQSGYGLTWQRVAFVDLAAAAGAVTGAVFGCVANYQGCLVANAVSPDARSIQAWSALAGAGLGTIAGVFGTRHFVPEGPQGQEPDDRPSLSMAIVMPMRDATGGTVPAFAAMGSF